MHLNSVGWFFRTKAQPGLKPAEKGQKLTFRRDLANTVDPNAVGVFRGADHIGYLGKAIAEDAAPLLFDAASGAPLRHLSLDGTCLAQMVNKDHRFRLDIKLKTLPGEPPLPLGTLEAIRAFCRKHDFEPEASAAATPSHLRQQQAAGQRRAEPVRGQVIWPPPDGPPGDVDAWAVANAPSKWGTNEIEWMCVFSAVRTFSPFVSRLGSSSPAVCSHPLKYNLHASSIPLTLIPAPALAPSLSFAAGSDAPRPPVLSAPASGSST